MRTPKRTEYFDFIMSGRTHHNMIPYMEYLERLASECKIIVEFGVNTGSSTTAFACGLPADGLLVSYDLNHDCHRDREPQPECRFIVANTAKLESIPECDLLFIDTLHTYTHIKEELKHGNSSWKFICIHDTAIHETLGEDGSRPGIWQAVLEFLEDNLHWTIRDRMYGKWGMTTLERTSGVSYTI